MVQDSPSRKQDQFIVRLPDGMRDRIREAAEANNRSMNAEIVVRLEASFMATDKLTDIVRRSGVDDRWMDRFENIFRTYEKQLAEYNEELASIRAELAARQTPSSDGLKGGPEQPPSTA